MKSDVIIIDNQGNGFDKLLEETRKVAAYEDLTHKESLCLQLCAEEMLSLARSITGEMKASFWIETESRTFDLHLTTKTVMDKEKRSLLLGAATSGKNEAAVKYEQSILRRLADTIRIGIRGDNVDMTVTRKFA